MYSRIALVLLVAAAVAGCGAISRATGTMGDVPEDSGWLELTVNVRGAGVFVDDALRGMIRYAGRPQLIVIPAGTHELRVEKFGWQTYTARIAVEPGAINTLIIDMERLPTEVVELPE